MNTLDKLKIVREGNILSTLYDNRTIHTATVSKVYEHFDFAGYCKEVIDTIMNANSNHVKIEKYSLCIIGGYQELRLYSEHIDINGVVFRKVFNIISSSNRNYALRLSYGLYFKSPYQFNIISSNGSVHKKHYNGVTEYANEGVTIDPEIFDQNLELMKKLVGFSVRLDDVINIISTNTSGDVSKTSEQRVKVFINLLLDNLMFHNRIRTAAKLQDGAIERLKAGDFSFEIDAFTVLSLYLSIFTNDNSVVVLRETERIMNITNYMFMQNSFNEDFDMFSLDELED